MRPGTGKLLLGLALLLLVFMGLVARLYSLPSPDLRLGYTPADLALWIKNCTPTGRRAFAVWHLLLDGLWPLVYGALLWRAVPWVRFRCRIPAVPWLRSWIIGAVVADYAENLLLSWLFLTAEVSRPLAWLAALFTTVKWLFLALVLVFLAPAALCAVLLRNRS